MEPQWPTTPKRQKTASPKAVKKSTTAYPQTRARKLFQQAFPSDKPENRFSLLADDPPRHDKLDMSTTSIGNASASSANSENHSFTDSDNVHNSMDDSMDGMSLVSNSEIDDLARDSILYDEEGYDTDTTDNTSPSKPSKTPRRQSSLHARSRISELYTSSDALLGNLWDGADCDSASQQSITSDISPHPLLDTKPNSEGHGAENT
jgi:hypothetical protein